MSRTYGYPAGDKPASELNPPPPAACKPIPPIAPGTDKKRPPDPRYGAIPAEGRFIEPHKREPEHQCPLPQQWALGALWQCPKGHLWVVENACECRGNIERHGGRGMHAVGYAWWPASWSNRRKYGPGMKRASLSMAPAELREENYPKLKPPKPPTSESGVSPGRSGFTPEDFDG